MALYPKRTIILKQAIKLGPTPPRAAFSSTAGYKLAVDSDQQLVIVTDDKGRTVEVPVINLQYAEPLVVDAQAPVEVPSTNRSSKVKS